MARGSEDKEHAMSQQSNNCAIEADIADSCSAIDQVYLSHDQTLADVDHQ
jgi:hypothetical protein